MDQRVSTVESRSNTFIYSEYTFRMYFCANHAERAEKGESISMVLFYSGGALGNEKRDSCSAVTADLLDCVIAEMRRVVQWMGATGPVDRLPQRMKGCVVQD